jgi:hypothetical protein
MSLTLFAEQHLVVARILENTTHYVGKVHSCLMLK